MRLNHKNKDILSQTNMFFELIAELLMEKKVEVLLKMNIFNQTVMDLKSYTNL